MDITFTFEKLIQDDLISAVEENSKKFILEIEEFTLKDTLIAVSIDPDLFETNNLNVGNLQLI